MEEGNERRQANHGGGATKHGPGVPTRARSHPKSTFEIASFGWIKRKTLASIHNKSCYCCERGG